MCRSMLVFCFLIIGLFSTSYGFECPSQLQPGCSCSKLSDKYMKLVYKVDRYQETRLIKHGSDEDNYMIVYCFQGGLSHTQMNEIIPAVELGFQKLVKIDLACPLGQAASIKNYFDRLGLTSVTELNLFGTESSKLTKDIFVGASTVLNLDLNHNYLVSVPADVFEGLTNLETIQLSENSFSSLPEQLFSNNKKLKKLLFVRNRNSLALPSGLLSNLPELEDANFQHSQVSSVPVDLFAGSGNIKSISLALNALETIPELLLSSQIHLEDLHLDNNNLADIPANLFKNNVALRILNLSDNKVKSLPANLFENNKLLRKIDLSVNEIKTIPDNFLSSLEHLEELDLHYNQIQRLTGAMLPAHIKSLNLYHNELEVIDPSFLARYNNGLYTHFTFEDNKIKCECNADFLALATVSSKVKAFIFYRCGNLSGFIVGKLDECKSRP